MPQITLPETTSHQPTTNGPAAEEVLTLAEAGAFLRMAESDVIGAVTVQELPGRKIGSEWRFSKSAILQWLNVCQPTSGMRRAAILSVAGIFKDDPDLGQVLEDAMRR